MTVREELHNLVNRLGDDQAREALAVLQRLVRENGAANRAATTGPAERTTAPAVSGEAFFSQPPRDLQALAAEQKVKPVTNFDALLGDFWPEDETADDFISTVRRWRREGGGA